MTLDDALRSERGKNLGLLRHGLAAAVIASHAWPLALGADTPEPLEALTGHSLGGWAVGVFFFLSGLLITASAERSSARRFWTARTRRILPGLVVAALVTLALAHAGGSTASPDQAASWFLRAVTLVSIEHRIPGAFSANPYPEVVNGPLWSLFHEVAAYGICACIVRTGATRRPLVVLALVALSVAAALHAENLPGRLATFAPLFAAFAFGMAAHVWRARIEVDAMMAVVILPWVLVLAWPLAIGIVGYGLLAVVLRAPALGTGDDLSYGLYIYGWPVTQTIVALVPGIGPVPLAILAVLTSAPLALLSWRWVERPALTRHRAVA